MSTREDRAADARDNARSAAHCLGCALGKPHQVCDWERGHDDND